MKVVHIHKSHYDVYIGRPSKWGNPFSAKEHGRKQAISLFKDYLYDCIKTGKITEEELLRELDGKILGCWCSPSHCHGHVYIEVIQKIKMYHRLGTTLKENIR